jgi:hypothetical protein
MKRSGLGQILAHQAIGVLVGSPLPGSVRTRKVGCGVESLFDLSMPGKPQAVIKGQRLDAGLDRLERLHNGIPYRLTAIAGHMSQQTEAGPVLDQADDCLLVTLADHCIALPVAGAATCLHAGVTL